MGEGDVYLPPRPQHGGFTGVLMDFNCSYVIPTARISIAGPNMPSSSGPEWHGHPTSGCRRLYTTLGRSDRPQTLDQNSASPSTPTRRRTVYTILYPEDPNILNLIGRRRLLNRRIKEL